MTASYSSYAGSRTEKFFHEREREKIFNGFPSCVCMYVCLIFSFVGRRALATFSERDLCVRVRLAGLPQSPIYTFELLLIPFRVFSIYFFSLLSFSGCLRHCCAPHTIVVPVSVVMGSRRWAHRSLTTTTTTTTCTDSVVVNMQRRWNANTEENSFRLSVRSDPWGI